MTTSTLDPRELREEGCWVYYCGVDLLYFVDERLGFIRYFYEKAAGLFHETKRKIEEHEEPYDDPGYGSEYQDAPPFLEEWENADAAANITGATCLDLLQSTFHSFLHQYMREIGGAHLIPHLREMKKGSWFGNYRELFRRLLDIEWEKSGADIQFLEQVILTRNDFSHNLELGSLTAYQTDEHSKKYPESAFADLRWRRLFAQKPLIVPKDRVDQAIEVVHRLCEYLEELRHDIVRKHR
jgi:hypothetical protein